jgi:arylsulfatase
MTLSREDPKRGSSSSSHCCSVRRWIERSFMLAIGFMVCFGFMYAEKISDITNMEKHDSVLRTAFTSNAPRTTNNIKKESLLRVEADVEKLQKTAAADTNAEESQTEVLTEKLQEQPQIEEKPTQQPIKKDDGGEEGKSDGGRLNIVLFYADDWTMKVLGKLDPNVRTPNIDKMADRGMLFVNNCVTTSVCWISRATLMTGTYYSRHLQAAPFEKKMFETHNWNETLFPKLKNAGYYTGMFGKWHAPSPGPEMNAAFHERELYFGHHWINEYAPFGSGIYEHITDVNRRHAVKFLENRPKDKNFALKVSFFATHAVDETIPSYQPMNWSRNDIYPDDESHKNYTTIVPPKTATEKHWKELPHFFTDHNAGRLRWRNRWEPDVWQKNIRDLFAMATEVDWAIGEIIETLKKQGVENETLLVFTSDNGDLHGEHGLAEKWYPLEESMKVPLVIQDPRMPKKHQGTINTDWTLNVDLAPTLLGAAGLDPANFMQGRDIAELYLSGETTDDADDNSSGEEQERQNKWKNNILRYDSEDAKKTWRKEWFYEWNMGDPKDAKGHAQNGFIDAAFALITDEWKYIYWPLKVYEQLYHRSLDPYDEYDILQNYHLHQIQIQNNEWVEQEYRLRMETMKPTNSTPLGDSIESTMEIYTTMKARFQELKEHVQSGLKV